MIRYSLACVGEHEFEAWFSNSKAYDTQRKKKLVECPVCGSTEVRKQIMAPSVRSSDKAVPAEVAAAKAIARSRGAVERQVPARSEQGRSHCPTVLAGHVPDTTIVVSIIVLGTMLSWFQLEAPPAAATVRHRRHHRSR